jgi:CelD/BcsL family acetyltransferase involved in cellulose biosynthesis
MDMTVENAESLIVQRLAGPEISDGLRAEWGALEEAIFPRTPFTSPLWIDLWWPQFRRANPLFRDEFFGHVIRGADGRLVAVAPLMRTYCPSFGLSVMRIVQFIGNDPSLTEFRGIICRAEDHERVVLALAAYFLRRRGEWDVFRWHGLRCDASHYNSLQVLPQFIERESLSDYIMPMPSSWAALTASVSGNMRKNLRKAYELLERDKFSFIFRSVERPEEIRSAVEGFLKLHAARSEVADMIYHDNKFSTPRTLEFLFQYTKRFAERGEVKVFELEINGKVVASRLTFVIGSQLYMYFAGYDPAWRQYSVMTILMSEMIKWAIDRNLRYVNFSTGNDQSKLRWKPEEIVLYSAVQSSPTFRGRLAFRAFLAYEAASRKRAALGRRVPREKESASTGPDAAVKPPKE